MAKFQTREEAEVFAQELTAQFPGIRFEATSLGEAFPGTGAWVGLFDRDGDRCVSTIDSRESFDQLLSVAWKLTEAIADNQQSEEYANNDIRRKLHRGI